MNRRGKTKEGFLFVKQPSRFGKAWKRKWVVIRPNATKGSTQGSVLLELYQEKGAYNKTVTSLLLEGITCIKRVLSKSQPRAFEFCKGAASVALTLAADSEVDAQEWMEIFKKLLLPASEQKELTSIPAYGSDVMRLSMVPNKDSERLKLTGVYLAGVSRLQVTLHHVITGEKVLEWDLRHIKRFMLPSRGPQQDLEKIACLQISNRSPQGEGEYMFFSTSAKAFVETIYERLSSAITVKERRSRTSSMLFEIPPKELEQLAKAIQEGGDPGFVMVDADGSVEESAVFEDSVEEQKGDAKTNGDVKAATNGEASVGESSDTKEENASESEVNEASDDRPKDEVQASGEERNLRPDSADISAVESTNETSDENVSSNIENVTKNGEKDGDRTTETENAKTDIIEEKSNDIDQTENTTNADCAPSTEENIEDVPQEESVDNATPSSDTIKEATDSSSSNQMHDVATEPIDADEEEGDLSESTSEITPRMPPAAETDTAEPEDNKTPSQESDIGEDVGGKTDSTGESNKQVLPDASAESIEEAASATDVQEASATEEEDNKGNTESESGPVDDTNPGTQEESQQNKEPADPSSPETLSQNEEPVGNGDTKQETTPKSSLEDERTVAATEDVPAAEVTDVCESDKVTEETTESRELKEVTEDSSTAESVTVPPPGQMESEQGVPLVSDGEEVMPEEGAKNETTAKEAVGVVEESPEKNNETTEDSQL